MMRQMAKSGGGMPGLGNLPGGGKKSRGRQAPPPKKVKGKSGNPALRARQEQEATRRGGAQAAPTAPGSAFGLGGAKPPADPGDFDPSTLGNLFGGR